MILRAIDSSLTGDVGQVRVPQDLLDLSLHTIARPAVVDAPRNPGCLTIHLEACSLMIRKTE